MAHFQTMWVAIAAFSATALLLSASDSSVQNWAVKTNDRVQIPSLTIKDIRPSKLLSADAASAPEYKKLAEGVLRNVETRETLFKPVLQATSAVLLLVAAALRLVMPKQVAAVPLYSMVATLGEEDLPRSQSQSDEQKFAISRRGMAPVLGAMLSPSLGIFPSLPAMAADAPAGQSNAVVIADPKQWIADNLPGSLTSKEFVRLTADILVRQGIEPENTVACVGVCRDELCQPMVDEIEGEWGDAFNMTSLAGMLTLGKTGLKAAMAHSPVDKNGRERYFFLAFPHIAVDTAGVGKCTRPGRNKTSSACGALVAFTNELKSGNPSTEYDPLDPEYSYMKTALMGLIPAGTAPDLLEVTKTAAEASLSQIEDLIAATVDPTKADYAVCTGVLVHQQDLRGRDAKVVGPSRQYVDQVWPTAFYVVKNGRKKDLIWRLERD